MLSQVWHCLGLILWVTQVWTLSPHVPCTCVMSGSQMVHSTVSRHKQTLIIHSLTSIISESPYQEVTEKAFKPAHRGLWVPDELERSAFFPFFSFDSYTLIVQSNCRYPLLQAHCDSDRTSSPHHPVVILSPCFPLVSSFYPKHFLCHSRVHFLFHASFFT